jgi:FkbH-like protein
MYETVDNCANVRMSLPPETQRQFRELASTVEARSLMVWGEHCSECAFPTCYTSCAFYTPRRDLHCRRFADGIERGKIGNVALGRLRFRRWAKLEGAGPLRLFSRRNAILREWLDRLLSALIINFAPTRSFYGRLSRYWNQFKGAPAIASAPGRVDAFVVEAWLASGPPIPLTVTFLPVGGDEQRLFQSRFDLHTGYNRFVLPYADIAARVDLSDRFLTQIEPVGDAAGREVVFGLIDFVRFTPEALPADGPDKTEMATTVARAKGAKRTRTAKCVVWDLDETLWRGTLAEDGREGLMLNPAALATIVELDRRGILQSIASKNDPESALTALQSFGIRDYFLFPQIGWGPKSASVKQIAEQLDIGLDTFVFIDDQPFERGEVGETLPEVTVLPETDIPNLLTSPLFDVPATPESAKRRALYQTEERRQATFAGSDTDYVTFLRDCRIRLEISDLSVEHQERAYELSQRTNQLNVSGTKYSRDDIKALLSPSSKYQAYILRCEDRFGDYGVIGMCVVDRQTAHVESFMMSCRVQRKRVEQSFFGWLSRELSAARQKGSIEVSYRKTARNQAVVKMLDQLGFQYHAADDSSGTFVKALKVPIAEDDVVEVVNRTAARSPELSNEPFI